MQPVESFRRNCIAILEHYGNILYFASKCDHIWEQFADILG
jgi:hypothetical protein